jgi:hypothetical protein
MNFEGIVSEYQALTYVQASITEYIIGRDGLTTAYNLKYLPLIYGVHLTATGCV